MSHKNQDLIEQIEEHLHSWRVKTLTDIQFPSYDLYLFWPKTYDLHLNYIIGNNIKRKVQIKFRAKPRSQKGPLIIAPRKRQQKK